MKSMAIFLTTATALLGWNSALPAASPSRQSSPRLLVMAEHASALAKELVPGDIVFAFCPRRLELPAGFRPGTQLPKPLPEPKWDELRFAQRLATMAAVQGEGLEKAVVFSTLADLQSHAEKIPAGVAWVAYNSEEGMTPAAELRSLGDAVRQFATLAHRHGWKMMWAPTDAMLRRSNDDLLRWAGQADAIILQHQRLLQSRGRDAFKEQTLRRAEAIHKSNAKCLVIVQAVLGRSTPDQISEAFQAVRGGVDAVCVWTMQDAAGIATVLKGLRKNRP